MCCLVTFNGMNEKIVLRSTGLRPNGLKPTGIKPTEPAESKPAWATGLRPTGKHPFICMQPVQSFSREYQNLDQVYVECHTESANDLAMCHDAKLT